MAARTSALGLILSALVLNSHPAAGGQSATFGIRLEIRPRVSITIPDRKPRPGDPSDLRAWMQEIAATGGHTPPQVFADGKRLGIAGIRPARLAPPMAPAGRPIGGNPLVPAQTLGPGSQPVNVVTLYFE